jgi:predicted glutamine amidotransferase
MCRIFGFSGESSPEVVKIINGLILAQEKSNPHGTGLALIDNRGIFHIKKKGLRGLHFIARGYNNFLWDTKFKYLIGHVRYKTSGEQSDRNAHPFGSQVKDDWYFLIHNGVLGDSMREIAKNFGANKLSDVKVDSELFLRCITAQLRQGIPLIDAIKKATYEVSDVGDFAFALLTKKGIYLWRNDQRPLSVFYYKENIFFASTMDMWKEALELAGVRLEKISYTEIKPYRLYMIKMQNSKPALFCIDENMPKKERIVVEKPKKKSSWSYYGDYYYNLFKDENKKKTKSEPELKYNPFLFGGIDGNYGKGNSKEDDDEDYFGFEKKPEEMTTEEIEEELTFLEDYYYTNNLSAEEQIDIEARIQELEHELNLRTLIVDKEGEDDEPF